MLSKDEVLEVANAMKQFGGSFVEALGECFIKADPVNQIKLHNAFTNLYEQYKKISEEEKR